MTDYVTREIVNFFIRYLVLRGLPARFHSALCHRSLPVLLLRLLGFFTFFQMLIAIPKESSSTGGSWKPLAIAGALSDVAVLCGGWAGGSQVLVDSTGSSWPYGCLSTSSLPSSRGDSARSFHSPDPQRTSAPLVPLRQNTAIPKIYGVDLTTTTGVTRHDTSKQ